MPSHPTGSIMKGDTTECSRVQLTGPELGDTQHPNYAYDSCPASTFATKRATATPTSAGESSWRK